jgi:hypothetical protein
MLESSSSMKHLYIKQTDQQAGVTSKAMSRYFTNAINDVHFFTPKKYTIFP